MNPWGLDPLTLNALLSGQSVVDMPRLAVRNLDQASEFLLSYGYDMAEPSHVERLWYFHRRALVYLHEVLEVDPLQIPDLLKERKSIGDLRRLLFLASSTDPNERELQKWSCRLLRVMHVFVHAESDLFSTFSEEIQKQILSPFQQSVFTDGASAKTILRAKDDTGDSILLEGFEIKPFKTSTSTVTKLLAKPDAYAMNVLDRMGVRFITKSILDAFRVLQFLIQQNLISYPHIMPDQSVNTIYPVSFFYEVLAALQSRDFKVSDEEVESLFAAKLAAAPETESLYLKKGNSFSGEDYRFIKLITRRMIRVSAGERGSDRNSEKSGAFSFFFPFEVQILDHNSYLKIQEGPSRHQAYKQRQREAARSRVLAEKTEFGI